MSPLSLGGGQVKVTQVKLDFAQRVIFTHPVPVKELHVERLLANLAPRDLTQKLRTYLTLRDTFSYLELEGLIPDRVCRVLDSLGLLHLIAPGQEADLHIAVSRAHHVRLLQVLEQTDIICR